jgi:hypothetical protein
MAGSESGSGCEDDIPSPELDTVSPALAYEGMPQRPEHAGRLRERVRLPWSAVALGPGGGVQILVRHIEGRGSKAEGYLP